LQFLHVFGSQPRNLTGTMRQPVLALIAALDNQRLIGARGELPWHLPEDLKLFRQLTVGNTVVMGRKTFDALGSPLPGRHNIVLSRTLDDRPEVTLCRTFSQALAASRQIGRPVFFIGGASVYRKALEIVDEMHISWIAGDHRGDTWFPEVDFSHWRVVEERDFEGFRYVRYRRKP